MPLYQGGLPREALPPSWRAAEVTDGRIAYRYRRSGIELAAVCRPADRSHPSLGLGRCWELRYRFSFEEYSTTESIGRVATRRAALEGLLECMHRVHDAPDAPEDPMAVETALDSVSLSDPVPDDASMAREIHRPEDSI